MTFLPIVERELRVGARRPATYWSRFWVVAAVLLLGTILLLLPNSVSPPKMAQSVFRAIGSIALAFALISGLFFTSDTLSSEKREGTIGLLFLTDLKGFDVVLGKLASTSLQGFYALMGVFPILAIPLLMGGVSGREFRRLILTLLATILFSLSTGLAVSASSRETRKAILGTLVLLVLFSGVGPAFWWALNIFAAGKLPENALLYTSPVYSFIHSLDAYYRPEFWVSLSVILMLALGFQAWASLLLPRIWQERQQESGPVINNLFRRLRYGTFSCKRKKDYKLLENPVYWLASRDRYMRLAGFLFIGCLLMLWLCFLGGFLQQSRGRGMEEAFWILNILLFAMHAVLKIMTTIEATRQLAEDFHSGALELLGVTPLLESEIIYGLRRAVSEQFAWLMVPVALATLFIGGLFSLADPLDVDLEDRIVLATIMLGGIILLKTDCVALTWVGLQMALRGYRPHRAVLATLKRVMLPPWLGMFLFFVLGFSGFLNDENTKGLMALWFLGCFILDFMVTKSARKELGLGIRCLVERAKFGQAPDSGSLAQNPPFVVAQNTSS